MLARSVGRLDVDAMLSEMTPAQFNGWFASYRVSPWGDEYKRTSLITTEICNVIRGMAMSFGKERMKESDFLDRDFYVPKWYPKGQAPQDERIAEQCAAADSLEGFGF